jgi:acyl-homoserine-lactone acylase
MNVSGAAFIGTPFVTVGMTENMAWSGTIADAVIPLTLFELTLDGPTSYTVDGRSEAMHKRDVTVEVKQPDGSIKPVTRTQWSTRYGPVVTNVRGMRHTHWPTRTRATCGS